MSEQEIKQIINCTINALNNINYNWNVIDFAKHVYGEDYNTQPAHRQQYLCTKFASVITPLGCSNLDKKNTENLVDFIYKQIER